jgi:hypothetical protein
MWRGVERRVNRRFSISARKLAVRAHIPWYLRWGMMLPFVFAAAEQLKNMTDENARLQEDLVFFQNLTAASGKTGEMGVHRLTLERDKMPGEYNLRMLLVQSGQRAKMFVGSYQLVATVVENGRSTTHIFPQDESGNAQFKLSFRYYRRVEQSIQLPPDAQLESVQVRIFEQGATEPKVRQSVSLPLTQGVNNVQ